MNSNPGLLLLTLIGGLCGLVLVIVLLSKVIGRDKRRQKRLEILEEALKRGEMDSELRREVVEVLKSEHSRGFSWRHLVFSLGWLGMFFGGGFVFLGEGRDHVEHGVMVLVASLAIVTLPLAIRELEARRAPDRGAS